MTFMCSVHSIRFSLVDIFPNNQTNEINDRTIANNLKKMNKFSKGDDFDD